MKINIIINNLNHENIAFSIIGNITLYFNCSIGTEKNILSFRHKG